MDDVRDVSVSPGDLEDRLLPWSQVKVISGLSRTTVWRLQKTGDFPAAVQMSPNRVGWWQSEILAWRKSRIPRRLPVREPASFWRSADRAGRGEAVAAEVRTGEERVPVPGQASPGPRPAAGRRRGVPVAANQTAFDFGA